MARESFLDTPSDMKWLRETHLKKRVPRVKQYKSAVIIGNEDFPREIRLYRKVSPRYTDKAKVYVLDSEGRAVLKSKRSKSTRHAKTY